MVAVTPIRNADNADVEIQEGLFEASHFGLPTKGTLTLSLDEREQLEHEAYWANAYDIFHGSHLFNCACYDRGCSDCRWEF